MLTPWTIGIATQLPHNAVARHWNIAWAGLDVAITVGLALTSWLGHRQDRRAALTATATVTLMCADAWFDLCTSGPDSPLAYAVAEAATELTVAAACLVIGLRTPRASITQVPDGAGVGGLYDPHPKIRSERNHQRLDGRRNERDIPR